MSSPHNTSSFWKTKKNLYPILFSLGIHLTIILIICVPTSLFDTNETPEIYSVELVDLSEPKIEPEPSKPEPIIAKPVPITEPTLSTKTILSTRNIPKTPSEIKILRPRKSKKDLRKDKPVIDQTIVLAALQRMKKAEKEQQAQAELDKANQELADANEEMLQALRESILTRPSDTRSPTQPSKTLSNKATTGSGAQQQAGNRVHSILTQYKATMGQHIRQHWRLPKGQKWDEKLKTTLIVKIKTDGIVVSAKIATASKSKQFDKFVIETIEKASPLPPIPSELDSKPLKIRFHPRGII